MLESIHELQQAFEWNNFEMISGKIISDGRRRRLK